MDERAFSGATGKRYYWIRCELDETLELGFLFDKQKRHLAKKRKY